MPLVDVHSTIEAAVVQPKTGLGMPLFVYKDSTVPAGTPIYKEFRTKTAFLADPDLTAAKADSTLLGKIDKIFEQKSRHEKFAILSTDDIDAGIKAFIDKDFYFILSADDVPANQLVIAQHVNSNFNKRLRIAILSSLDVAAGAPFKTLENVISLYSPVATDYMDAALVAEVGSQRVGSVTWKFKTLYGVTTQYLTEDKMLEIDDSRMIAYAFKHGEPQTTEGWLSYINDENPNPQFIDTRHGEAWVRYDVEKRIARTLKTNPKIPYDPRGPGVLLGDATTTLKEAADMGIIGQDEDGVFVFSASAASIDDQTAEDKATRKYRGINYSYKPSGAIHEVWVTGTVLV